MHGVGVVLSFPPVITMILHSFIVEGLIRTCQLCHRRNNPKYSYSHHTHVQNIQELLTQRLKNLMTKILLSSKHEMDMGDDILKAFTELSTNPSESRMSLPAFGFQNSLSS